jgi:hypothetical protein
MRTIQELAKEALDVQDASNLRGVLNGFSEAIASLNDIMGKQDGQCHIDAIHKHPVAKLWAWKIAAMTGTECLCLRATEQYSQALQWCSDHAQIGGQ